MKQCPHCKAIHNEHDCPFWIRSQTTIKLKSSKLAESFSGSSPAPFIGHYGYPNINVGLLSLPEYSETPWIYDAPRDWAEQKYTVGQVVDLRTSLLNAKTTSNIRSNDKIIELVQEIAMAKNNSAQVEINLKKQPAINFHTDPFSAPYGPTGEVKNVELTNNPDIPTKIDKVVSDTELKATDALNYLYYTHFDESILTRLLSVGVLGVGKNRKLVPTRWAITAVDDQLGKQVISNIKEYNFTNYEAYFGSCLGNYYLVLFIPDLWSYELFEIFIPTKAVATDYEGFKERTSYSDACSGGYYTVRLAVAEKLKKIKRQASALVFRFITDEYTLPLGVWVTREATRNAMKGKPIQFVSKELLLQYAISLTKRKFGYDLNLLIKQSSLLKNVQKQKRLLEF